jgi:hypothetical protein
MSKIESSDPNIVTMVVKGAPGQATDLFQLKNSADTVLWSVDKDGKPGTGTGDVVGPSSATDNAVARFDTTTGKKIQSSLMTVNDSGSPNIPAGQTYNINGTAIAYGDVGAAASSHNHAGTDITSGSIDGDRLPAPTSTKRGGVPATGTPSGLFLKDDDSWATPPATGVKSAADYVIYKSGSTYYAQNGSTFATDYSSTSFYTVMNSVLAAGARLIELRSGTYTLDTTGLTITEYGTHIRGAGRGATIITTTADIDAITVRGAGGYMNCLIEDMTLDHTGTTDDTNFALVLDSSPFHTTIRNIEIKNYNGTTGGGVKLRTNAFYLSFEHILMFDSVSNGFTVWNDAEAEGDNGQTTYIDCQLSCRLDNFKRNPMSASGSHRHRFYGCGIYLPWGAGTYAVDLKGLTEVAFYGCDFEGDNAAQSWARIEGGTISFHGCWFFGQNTAGFLGFNNTHVNFDTQGVTFHACYFYMYDATCSVIHPRSTINFFGCYKNPSTAAWKAPAADDNLINLFGCYSGSTSVSTVADHIFNCSAGGLAARYVSSAVDSPPTLATNGEVVVWHDSTNNKEYLMIRSNGATFKAEFT